MECAVRIVSNKAAFKGLRVQTAEIEDADLHGSDSCRIRTDSLQGDWKSPEEDSPTLQLWPRGVRLMAFSW